MATVISEISFRALAKESPASGTVTGLGVREFKHALDFANIYASGISDSQNDLAYSDTRTISGAYTYDLTALTSQMDSVAVSFAEVTWIIVETKNTNTATLTIGGGSNPFIGIWTATGDGCKIGASGLFVWGSPVNGVAPVAGTGDIITLTPSTGSIEYKILILGRSA